jgi:hypothetical protein
MKRNIHDVPVKVDTPDAVARQQMDFGDTSGYGELSGEYFTLGAGTDLTPLLEGLEADLCQCPHWGYVLDGTLHVRYTDGTEEVTEAGEAVYWPPGHTIFTEDSGAEFVLFSPADEHGAVLGHLQDKLSEMEAD